MISIDPLAELESDVDGADIEVGRGGLALYVDSLSRSLPFEEGLDPCLDTRSPADPDPDGLPSDPKSSTHSFEVGLADRGNIFEFRSGEVAC
jgi:hypothetical protein